MRCPIRDHGRPHAFPMTTQASGVHNMKSLVKKFASNEDGAFATIFGVSSFAIALSVGLAVDYSQLSAARSLVNVSLDAAVLAAGHELLDGNENSASLRKIFENQLYANLESHSHLANAVEIKDFSVDVKSGLVNATLETPVQMAFMGLLGYQKVPVASFSEAKFSTTPVEISMVLDVTGSMNDNGKLPALKNAATKAIDILLPSGKTNNSVKIGLVPYSEGVRVSKKMADTASGQKNFTCMTERKVNAFNDSSYSTEEVGADPQAGCSFSKVQPLSGNGASLKGDINSLTASGYTAGHLGISWGYYMLSEKWQSLWGANAADNYGTSTKKVVILMTDGEFNTYFQGVSGNPTGAQQAKSEDAAKALCTDMKKSKKGGNGITIYSIAFNAPNSAKQVLENCASDSTPTTNYFFDANSPAELELAFKEIATSIKSLRLTQ